MGSRGRGFKVCVDATEDKTYHGDANHKGCVVIGKTDGKEPDEDYFKCENRKGRKKD